MRGKAEKGFDRSMGGGVSTVLSSFIPVGKERALRLSGRSFLHTKCPNPLTPANQIMGLNGNLKKKKPTRQKKAAVGTKTLACIN